MIFHLKAFEGILWEIYDRCSEVFLHQERKFVTVWSGQNDQKYPQKLKKKKREASRK